jgi:hypothetical protein
MSAILLVAINVLCAAVGWCFGYWQGKTARSALNLNVRKAAPKIGTTAQINKRQVNPPAYPPFYYLVMTIYNEGELPAKQLNGHCKLLSPNKAVKECNIPISRDFLGSSPYEMEICRLEDGIGGSTIDIGGSQGQHVRFNVEFEFFGISEEKPEPYSAKYEYDPKSRQLVRIP